MFEEGSFPHHLSAHHRSRPINQFTVLKWPGFSVDHAQKKSRPLPKQLENGKGCFPWLSHSLESWNFKNKSRASFFLWTSKVQVKVMDSSVDPRTAVFGAWVTSPDLHLHFGSCLRQFPWSSRVRDVRFPLSESAVKCVFFSVAASPTGSFRAEKKLLSNFLDWIGGALHRRPGLLFFRRIGRDFLASRRPRKWDVLPFKLIEPVSFLCKAAYYCETSQCVNAFLGL